MSFTGRAVRQGNTTNFGAGSAGAFPRAAASIGGNLYVVLADSLVRITDLANGSGTRIVNQNHPSGEDTGGAFVYNNQLYITTVSSNRQLLRYTNLANGTLESAGNLPTGGSRFRACTSDGTTVWAVDQANNKLYTLDPSDVSVTEVGDITFEAGVTELGLQGMFIWGDRHYLVGGNTDKLYLLPDLATQPTMLLATAIDSTVNQFGVSQRGPAGACVHNGEAYLIGGNPDALYRFINPPVVPDSPARLVFAEQTAETFDMTETIDDLESLAFQTGHMPPTYLTISGTDLVVAATNPAIDADTDFNVLLTATRGADSVDFTQPMRARNVSTTPNTAPAFANTSYAFTDVAIAVGTVVGTVAATDADSDDLRYSLTGTDASDFAIDSDGQITVATALTYATSYSFNVVANDGTTTTSVPVTVTAVAAPPPTDAVLSMRVSQTSVIAGRIATVTFSFDKAVSGFTAADVTVSAGATKGALTDAGNNAWTLPVTAPSSGSGTVTVSVGADVVTPGNNADSVQFAYTAPPPPPPVQEVPALSSEPMDVKVELTPTTALMTWKAPTNGASLTGYEISYAEGASPGTDWIPTESLSTRFVVKGLKRGTQYTWQVRGVTESGPGTASRPVTERTPIASLHNALFFKECINYFDDGGRISEHGNASNIIRAVADNNYKTFTREKDLVINIAVNGQPTRVDAIFVKGIDIEGHSAAPNGGTGVGYSNRMMPTTVKNWEGTDVSTIVNGFQHDLYLLDQHFTATNVRLTFTGANAKIVEVMCLEFGISIDANGDFLDMNPNFVDREGVIHPDPGGGIVYDSPIGSERDKWQIDYVVKIVPGKTMLETPEDFLYWRAENRNHVFCMEPSRHPARVFPATFVRKSVPIRYRTDSKTSGEILSFRVAEQ